MPLEQSTSARCSISPWLHLNRFRPIAIVYFLRWYGPTMYSGVFNMLNKWHFLDLYLKGQEHDNSF